MSIVLRKQRMESAHPLATRSGLHALGQALTALNAWMGCTPRQRDVLRALHPAVLQAVEQAEDEVLLPRLQGAHARTRKALLERRLADEDDQLTALGGLVVFWWAGERRSAAYDPGDDVPPARLIGDRL